MSLQLEKTVVGVSVRVFVTKWSVEPERVRSVHLSTISVSVRGRYDHTLRRANTPTWDSAPRGREGGDLNEDTEGLTRRKVVTKTTVPATEGQRGKQLQSGQDSRRFRPPSDTTLLVLQTTNPSLLNSGRHDEGPTCWNSFSMDWRDSESEECTFPYF